MTEIYVKISAAPVPLGNSVREEIIIYLNIMHEEKRIHEVQQREGIRKFDSLDL